MKKEDAQSPAVHLVCGDDDYLIDQKARALVEAACPEAERALGLEIIEADAGIIEEALTALAHCLEAIQTVGFFGGRKVVWLRNASFFSDSVVGKSKEVKALSEPLTDLIKAGLPDGHALVISAVNIDRRTAFYKVCKQNANLIEYQTPTKTREADQSAMERVRDMWAECRLQPERGQVLDSFVQRVGTDTRQLMQETEKLATYIGTSARPVTIADLDAVVASAKESIAWALADQVGRRELVPAIRTLRQLLFQRESPIGLIFGLESRFRELILLRECMRRNWLHLEGSERFQKAVWTLDGEGEARLSALQRDPRKTHPYRLIKLIEQANRFSLRHLLRIQQDLAKTHENMVSTSVPQALQLELLVIRTVGKPVATSAHE